jgi:hypothetical protein
MPLIGPAGSAAASAAPVTPGGGRQLVVTDAVRYGRHALTIPFAEVTLVGLDDATIAADPPYDQAAIDLHALDVESVVQVAALIRPLLGPGGVVAVLLSPDISGGRSDILHGNGMLRGWEWAGLREIDGELAALLRPGPPEADAGTPFLAAYATANFLIRKAAETDRMAEAALAEQAELTARSERALLDRLAALAEEADRVRRDHRGSALVRTLLRRSKGGRVVLRVAKLLRRR